MPHIDIHQGSPGKWIVRFVRDHGDLVIAVFADVSRGIGSGYSIAYDDDFHSFIFDCYRGYDSKLKLVKKYLVKQFPFGRVMFCQAMYPACSWKGR